VATFPLPRSNRGGPTRIPTAVKLEMSNYARKILVESRVN
jgi:hypothetical protein